MEDLRRRLGQIEDYDQLTSLYGFRRGLGNRYLLFLSMRVKACVQSAWLLSDNQGSSVLHLVFPSLLFLLFFLYSEYEQI